MPTVKFNSFNNLSLFIHIVHVLVLFFVSLKINENYYCCLGQLLNVTIALANNNNLEFSCQ